MSNSPDPNLTASIDNNSYNDNNNNININSLRRTPSSNSSYSDMYG